MADLKDLQKLLRKAALEIPEKALQIIEVEGINFIKKNFRDEGFNTGAGVKKWDKRQTEDKRGRDITRYRTNKRGKRGSFNKYGRSIQNRALLIGHNTAGDKLSNSFRAVRRGKYSIGFVTYKKYGQRHNEGLAGMPQRQFMGPSKFLDKRIFKKLKRVHDKKLKR